MSQSAGTSSPAAASGTAVPPRAATRAWWAAQRLLPGPRDAAALLVVLTGSLLVTVALAPSLGIPFFTDEAWRGYFISLGARFPAVAHEIPAPLAFGWMLVARASTLVFGNTETVLRAGTLFLVPPLALATYALARRVAGRIVAAVCALAVVANTGVMVYATEFKSYVGEALVTVLILLAWPVLFREQTRSRVAYPLAFLVGLLATYSLPAIFLLLPLAAVTAASGLWRARGPGGARQVLYRARRAVSASALAVLPGLLHMEFFVGLQTAHVRTAANLADYWNVLYLPAHGIFGKLRLVTVRFGSWLYQMIANGMPQPRDKTVPQLLPHVGVLSWLAAVGLAAGLAGSLLVLRRSPPVRWMWVAVGGSAAVIAVLADLRYWPFGWTRVNLFIEPLFYVLAAAGVAELGRRALAAARGAAATGPPARRSVLAAAGALGVVAVAAGTGAAARISVTDLRAIRAGLPVLSTAQDMRPLAAALRSRAVPADIAIAAVQSTQFRYYVDYYQGYQPALLARPVIPPAHILGVGRFEDPAIVGFMRAHAGAPRVFLFEAYGVGEAEHRVDSSWVERFGYVPAGELGFPNTGLLTEFRLAR